jgi:sugar O-acyltransferase (sialic acid O-acetyltransferase NeuD family)
MAEKHKLFIIGASNFGREMENWLQLITHSERDWELKGYLHHFDGKSPLEGYPTDLDIVGDWRTYDLTKNDYCIIAVADCSWKEKIYNYLKNKTTFLTYVAPDIIRGKSNTLGDGSIICPGCIITTNIRIGKCVTINIGSQIGHDSVIGDFTSIMPHVDFGGNVTVGKNVFIGTKATIIPKITIKDGATVGAGSVVVKNVSRSATVFGNPAKKIN